MENVVVKESRISGKGVFSARSFKKDEEILDIDDSHVVTDTTKLTREQHELERARALDEIVSLRCSE